MLSILKTIRLPHIDLLLNRSVQESTHDIHLMEFQIKLVDIEDEESESLHPHNRGEGIMKMNTRNHTLPIRNPVRLVAVNRAISQVLFVEYPKAIQNFSSSPRFFLGRQKTRIE